MVSPLRDIPKSNKPFLGICLGMQLLMTESQEFGRHRGLGIIEGEVTQLRVSQDGQRALKVPQVGWNQIRAPKPVASKNGENPWTGTLWEGLADGEYMYFVHSYVPNPADGGLATSFTRYGDNEFCSSLRRSNLFACQFHPERSGPQGMKVYQNLAEHVMQQTGKGSQCLNR